MQKRFIDAKDTFKDWNHHKNDICIVPVGAMEQHSTHLPLMTDSLLATCFATHIAEKLEAALLPVLSIATSYEHSGFRGTFSLKPETLMAILRDLASEAEQQSFRTLIVFNYHGGNFSLMPAVRDWNRQERALKILLYFPRNMPRDDAELHAGEWETSLMMYLYPDLVKKEMNDIGDPKWLQKEFQPPDLNTFGVGHISEHGAVGFATKASSEKGKKYAEWVKKDSLNWIRQRLDWLHKQRHYSGRGGVTLRKLTSEDLDRVMQLKEYAHWNQTRRDWKLFLECAPRGCFAAVKNGQLVGTTTTIEYDKLAWISMVLVDPNFRRQGIATRLLATAVNHLRHIESIKLDATAEGRQVYDRLGFKSEYKIVRMICTKLLLNPSVLPLEMVHRMNPDELKKVIEYDAALFGQNRGQVLRALYEDKPQYALLFGAQGSISGYCFGRSGSSYTQIGPLVSQNPDDARLLLAAFIKHSRTRNVVIDAQVHTPQWIEFLEQAGFEQHRYFIRMFKGTNRYAGNPKQQFAITGPEFG